MIIKKVTKEMLQEALAVVNIEYGGNIAFSRCEDLCRKRVPAWDVLLITKSSDKKAPGRLVSHGRRLPNACWHVHGMLFEYLLDRGATIDQTMKARAMNCPEDNWQDYHNGFGEMASQACRCNEHGLGKRGSTRDVQEAR